MASLALNAISSVVLTNLLKDENGVLQPIVMPRASPTPRKPKIYEEFLKKGKVVPKRLPSRLPPPGDAQLTLEIHELLGAGRSSEVYTASVVDSSGFSSDDQVVLPSFVVKVSRRSKAASLDREAWSYDEMETLQGSTIPRNYGLFMATPPANHRFAFPNLAKKPLEIPTVSILLLEATGGLVTNRDVSAEDRQDIYDLYHDLSKLRMYHNDLRTTNILRVPPDFPSDVCPFHKRKHRHRLVDFESSFKSNGPVKMIYDDHISWAYGIVCSMEEGCPDASEEVYVES